MLRQLVTLARRRAAGPGHCIVELAPVRTLGPFPQHRFGTQSRDLLRQRGADELVERDAILGLTGLALPGVAAFIIKILFWTTVKIGVALFILAILEYAFQKWKHEQDLKMTSQEVREEMRNLEGDPQIAARRRAVQRQLALNRMGEAVPNADVVITNPTELAVAIKYKPEKMVAPVVVAKGAGVLAKRIRRLALEHGIPIVEKKPLAQALYREVEVDQAIPQDKYAAVAEILAYVYQLKGKDVPGSKAA